LALAAAIQAGTLSHPSPCMPVPPLPAPITPFVGRQPELQQIGDHLAGRERRLLTLYGPGGCGKTRLALEVAAGQVPLWRDGVWFIPLVETPSPEALVDGLAVALGLQAGGQPVEAKQLLDFLRPKELLLILDSFEHLAAGASLLSDILRWAPEVRIVVTSRARLGVRGEWAIQMDGLKLPPEEPATVAEAEGCAAVQLFVWSARRVTPTFHLMAENLPHVVRICRLVGGLPLGIELAAAWVRLYHCRQIADEIEGSPNFLHAPDTGGSQRHYSLRGTFDYSYSLLSEAERALLRRLSVFRGGFGVAAARQVAGADPAALDSLLDKSLLQTSPARRLDLHLTLREYAAEKLAEHAGDETATRTQHSRIYLTFLRERQETIAGERGKEVLDEIQGELGNVRAAWRWAVAAGLIAELSSGLEALAQFYSHKGFLREAEAAFGEAAGQVAALIGKGAEAQHLTCRLLVQQASFLRRRGDYAQAIQVAQAAVALAQAAQEPLCEAMAAAVWGEALWRQGEFSTAREQLARALTLARDLPEGGKVAADSLNCLAGVCWRQGDYAGARKCLEDCLHLPSHAGRTRPRSIVLGNLGVVAAEQGDYAAARRCYREALDIEREIGEREGESASLTNLGNLSLYLGAYAEAEAYYHQALAIHRETGARQSEAWTLGNVGLLAHYQGDREAAQGYAREALQMAQEIGDRAMQATMWLELGHALVELAQPNAAAEAYRESLALRRELDQPNMATEPLAGLARVCQAQGDLGQAQAHVEAILHHLGFDGAHSATDRESTSGQALDGTISPFLVYLTCYRVLAAVQDSRGQDILATAHDLLAGRAARISDEKMRRSFLGNVAAHRELVQAFERAVASSPKNACRSPRSVLE
ncbi:MAG: tetratricopeptide repeat protein, partial [Chloroflexi bacterium]|nr:tetratricopeptide repeat protein [Chloroflexota bacterium]